MPTRYKAADQQTSRLTKFNDGNVLGWDQGYAIAYALIYWPNGQGVYEMMVGKTAGARQADYN